MRIFGAESGRAITRVAAAGAVCLLVANCSASNKLSSRVDPKYGVSTSPRVVDFNEPVPRGGGTYRVGKPYVVAGRTYVPEEDPNYRAEGLASWYGDANATDSTAWTGRIDWVKIYKPGPGMNGE